MAALLETLDLTSFQKELLRQRWLDQLSWVAKQASESRFRYKIFRLPVVLGGIAIPALITVTLASAEEPHHLAWLPTFLDFNVLRALTLGASLIVASLAALDGFFHYGERWRHYRRTTELLKTLGWQYLMLNGHFRRYKSHADAFVAFTERVEDALTEDVEGFMEVVASEAPEKARHEVVA